MKFFSLLLLLTSHFSFLTFHYSFAQLHQPLPADSQLPESMVAHYLTRDSIQTFKGMQLSTGYYDSLYQVSAARRQIKPKALVFPALLLGYGGLSLKNDQLIKSNHLIKETFQSHYAGFDSKMDNYTRYASLAAVYGLNLAGIKGQHNLVDLSMLYIMSSFISRTATANLKKYARSERPDQSTFDSFPSQHTASAFAKAELLRLEFRHRSPWYGVAGYSFAIATGGLRMLNNRHWFSDVLAGAGVGILSTRIAYLVYPWLQGRIAQGLLKNVAVAPIYQEGSFGLGLAFRPGTGPLTRKK